MRRPAVLMVAVLALTAQGRPDGSNSALTEYKDPKQEHNPPPPLGRQVPGLPLQPADYNSGLPSPTGQYPPPLGRDVPGLPPPGPYMPPPLRRHVPGPPPLPRDYNSGLPPPPEQYQPPPLGHHVPGPESPPEPYPPPPPGHHIPG